MSGRIFYSSFYRYGAANGHEKSKEINEIATQNPNGTYVSHRITGTGNNPNP